MYKLRHARPGPELRVQISVASLLMAAAVLGGCVTAQQSSPPSVDAASPGHYASPSHEVSFAVAVDEVKRGEVARYVASQLLEAGEFDQAVQAFDLALDANPGDAYALLGRARAHGALGHDNRALGDLDSALALAPDSVETLLERAKLLRQGRRHGEALDDLAAVLDLQPDMITPRFAKAESHFALGQRMQADLELDAIDLLTPKAGEMFAARAMLPLRAGDNAAALWYLQRAMAAGHRSAAMFKIRGSLEANMGQPDAALESFNRAVALAPDDADAVFLRAGMQLLLGQTEGAKGDLRRALTLRPDYPEARILLNNLDNETPPADRAT